MSPDEHRIRTVEIAAARAWPASETAGTDGWLLRHTPLLDRARNNAALPPPGPPRGGRVPPGVDDVIAWYRARDIAPQIQVSPLGWHGALDAELAARGWVARYGANVLVAPVEAVLERGGGRDAPGEGCLTLREAPDDEWLRAWGTCEQRDPASCRAHASAVFAQLAPRATYALAYDGAEPIAVGIAVRDPGIAGIFCMATHPAHRRRGAAGRVLRALARDAASSGARTLYLQVDSRNADAGGLYAAHGFTLSHAYHFRRAAPNG